MQSSTQESSWTSPRRAEGINVQPLLRFARRKPLGAVCGLIVLGFAIIGDLIPETINTFTDLAGLERPVPYLADFLADNLSFLYPFSQIDLRHTLEGSSSEHLLGTDQSGRDVLSRILYGSRVAVMVAFGSVFITQAMATVIGVTAGFYGGVIDKVMYRFVDIFQALPGLVVLITIFGLFGTGLWPMIITIGIVGGPSGSRILRAQTISTMAMPFIEAARQLGATDMRIITRHVLPNIFPLIILGATLRLGVVILIEATVSFLGYGLPAPFPSWGQMLSLEGREFMREQPGLAVYPGLAIALLVFSFNMFGDALRDVLDPRLRGSK